MSKAKRKSVPLTGKPLVVGTIHSAGALRQALALKRGEVDVLELRVDHFADNPEPLLAAAPRLAAPLIVTVRHPAEGGAGSLSLSRRRELYAAFLSVAAFVDIEVRSCATLAPLISEARESGAHVIVSDHHFRSTPSISRLKERLSAARAAGASIFKLAALVSKPADLATLLSFLAGERRQPLSVMGMGALGKVSRLLFARTGSVLNYGYLDRPQVPGQWEATLLKQRIAETVGDR